MIRFLTIFVLTLISASAAQPSPDRDLILTGTVLDIRTGCVDQTITAKIGLNLQFRNEGDAPVLVLLPAKDLSRGDLFIRRLRFVNTKLGDTAERLVSADEVLHKPDPVLSRGMTTYPDPKQAFVDWIDAAEPPTGGRLTKIEPGGYYEFNDWIDVASGFRFGAEAGRPAKKCYEKGTTAVPEYDYCRIEFHRSLKDYGAKRDLFRTLRSRWKAFGLLVLDSDGGITYRSDPILIN